MKLLAFNLVLLFAVCCLLGLSSSEETNASPPEEVSSSPIEQADTETDQQDVGQDGPEAGDSDPEPAGDGKEGCGCAAASRSNLTPKEGDQPEEAQSEAEAQPKEEAQSEEAQPEEEGEDGIVEDDDEEDSKTAAQKYTAVANAISSYPRTNQMVKIAGGTFYLGTDSPIIIADGEAPSRRTDVDTFWFDVHEVSNAEFELFVNSTGYVTEVCSLCTIKTTGVGVIGGGGGGGGGGGLSLLYIVVYLCLDLKGMVLLACFVAFKGMFFIVYCPF